MSDFFIRVASSLFQPSSSEITSHPFSQVPNNQSVFSPTNLSIEDRPLREDPPPLNATHAVSSQNDDAFSTLAASPPQEGLLLRPADHPTAQEQLPSTNIDFINKLNVHDVLPLHGLEETDPLSVHPQKIAGTKKIISKKDTFHKNAAHSNPADSARTTQNTLRKAITEEPLNLLDSLTSTLGLAPNFHKENPMPLKNSTSVKGTESRNEFAFNAQEQTLTKVEHGFIKKQTKNKEVEEPKSYVQQKPSESVSNETISSIKKSLETVLTPQAMFNAQNPSYRNDWDIPVSQKQSSPPVEFKVVIDQIKMETSPKQFSIPPPRNNPSFTLKDYIKLRRPYE